MNLIFCFKAAARKKRQAKVSQSKKAQAKPLRAEVDLIMQKPSTSFKYVPTRLGAGKISIEDQIYDYHFKSQRINFWKCSKANCPAKAITRGTEAWTINNLHDHD